jgi:hypothetical protein
MDRLSRKEKDEFFQFIDTGKLGNIWTGMSKNHIIEVLGEPQSIYTTPDPSQLTEIYFYGDWLEVTLVDSILSQISIRYKWQNILHRCLKLPYKIGLSWPSRVARWDFVRVKNLLHSHRKSFALWKWDDGSLTIRITQEGSVIFDQDRRMGLHSINHSISNYKFNFPEARICTPPKVIRWPRAEKRKRRFVNMRSRI